MKKYKVQWDYRSATLGPWVKGEVVELDPALAEAVNRDSPGVLRPVTARTKKRAKKSSKDRMARGSKDRSV